MQRRHKGLNAGLLLLFSQIYQVGLNNIPPVTLATLAVNIFLFLQPLKPLMQTCISVTECFYRRDWHRLYLSAFHHADDWHLYFNMVSLLWKGIKLEKRLGSVWFGYIILLFSVLVGVVYMILEFTIAELLSDPSYEQSCAVGFSGVLFALKVLNNYYHPGGSSNIMGMNVSNKYACWLELIAIHLLSPGSSFAGHLAGILVGLMYTMGPLETIMKTCAGGLTFPAAFSQQRNSYNPEENRYSGYTSYAPRDYNMYTGGLNETEQFEWAIRNSLNDRGSGTRHYNGERRPYGFWFPPEQPSSEELRRRRLNRFERW
ncbi:rhomboid-related protein 4 isoform X1 [Sceloporus undulatus]|uniref:rhomboid-related protein 4 isoform X1 n=1 Tax=Sceloporus undulatus TaxID=8520 RepID=UPI001C4B050F|nr:rhomboid-related protein 4 isoform X1 [Sceloporus undulatus]XP_042315548.1 rhomboid-related protein 4 isoform X1 [Sceloporus undulatus]XP_042315549.1 rhomboid-related protein 4 isoform X1 [Sceloporus undulatus]XP_042315550.1 rhomboid-related protein 4 isoform X1 [Sceloporus undulatus]XP_042315551.1 rhomboid-related protein 4 isoform X1 [Sceloporus undulatus]XP_042315552.1 rhomboid-related protein 4 isoform X1 [Sceloporus undulatus]XP_042315553.1 rhomboid-related protein 4 isoform X1 [Scelo